MKFLKLASSFLNKKKSSNSKGIVSKVVGLFSAIGAIPIVMLAIPFVIMIIVSFVFFSTLSYKFSVLQFIDSIGNKKNSSVSVSGGQGTLTSDQRQQIVDFAYSQLGVNYNFSLSWENDIKDQQMTCNGLTRLAYESAGIDIPVGSVEQMLKGPVITSYGKVSDMTPGDIICYDYAGRVNRPDIDYSSMGESGYASHHVALYVGNGELIESDYGGVQKRPVQDYEYSYSITW